MKPCSRWRTYSAVKGDKLPMIPICGEPRLEALQQERRICLPKFFLRVERFRISPRRGWCADGLLALMLQKPDAIG